MFEMKRRNDKSLPLGGEGLERRRFCGNEFLSNHKLAIKGRKKPRLLQTGESRFFFLTEEQAGLVMHLCRNYANASLRKSEIIVKILLRRIHTYGTI